MSRRIKIPNSSDTAEMKRDSVGAYLDVNGQRQYFLTGPLTHNTVSTTVSGDTAPRGSIARTTNATGRDSLWVAGATTWQSVTADSSFEDPTAEPQLWDDFDNTATTIFNRLASAGGGSGQGWLQSTTVNHPEGGHGVIEANHGTGATSRLDLVAQVPAGYAVHLGQGIAYKYKSRFQYVNLSNGVNRYIGFDGFFDGNTTDPLFDYGVLFRYSDDINAGKIQALCRSAAGVETLVDTGILPVINTWYVFEIDVNAAGTEAVFRINGAIVATITTNIKIGNTGAEVYTMEMNNDRTVGTVNFVSRRVDYLLLRPIGVANRG